MSNCKIKSNGSNKNGGKCGRKPRGNGKRDGKGPHGGKRRTK